MEAHGVPEIGPAAFPRPPGLPGAAVHPAQFADEKAKVSRLIQTVLALRHCPNHLAANAVGAVIASFPIAPATKYGNDIGYRSRVTCTEIAGEAGALPSRTAPIC
ncbi:MAG: hypothetical protein ACREJM_06315, partial [Candidatus Saccharimonadales bacterium]